MSQQQTSPTTVEWIIYSSFFQTLNCECFSLEDPADGMNNEDFFQLMAKYKFTIAFENAIGDDYITEKLWRPLILGSVPIYMGSPSFEVN